MYPMMSRQPMMDMQPAYPDHSMGYGGQRYSGYQPYGSELVFLRNRYNQLFNLHQSRIIKTNMALSLYTSAEESIYGQAKRRDDETRIRSSKPHRIIEMGAGLVMNKPPKLNVIGINPNPLYTKSAAELETDLVAMADGWYWWRAIGRANIWAWIGGAGPWEYWYDQNAMDDEPLMCAAEIDPRSVVWKNNRRNDGTIDYCFTKVDTPLIDIVQRWGDAALGSDSRIAKMYMTDPLYKVPVYTYWAYERQRIDGRPSRQVICSVFTDFGFIKEPEVMVGYTKIPINIIRRVDHPFEQIDMGLAYEGALDAVYDELVQEIRFMAALINNAQDHINPSTVVKSNRPDIQQRVDPRRGSLIHLMQDEEVNPFQKSTAATPDVQTVLDKLGENIDGSTISKMFQGGNDLKDISGVTASISSTGPLIRFARSQQLLEDTLQQAIPGMLSCLARHALSEGRKIRVIGRAPEQQRGFHEAVLDQRDTMMLDGDVRVVAWLSASLPRDTINEITTLDGLQRSGKLSNRTVRQHTLRLFDIQGTNPEAEEQQIWKEKLEQMQFDMMTQMGPVAPPSVQQEFIPAGYQSGPGGQIEQDLYHQMGPEEPLRSSPTFERQPGPRYGPAVHDQLTGRGNEPTSNPLLHRRRAEGAIDQFGAMTQPMPRRNR